MTAPRSRFRWLALPVVLLLVAAGMAALAWRWVHQPLPLAQADVEVSIEPGTPPREVARAWVAAGGDLHPDLLYA